MYARIRPGSVGCNGSRRGGSFGGVWAQDDRTLYYPNGAFIMAATSVDPATGAVAGASRELFPAGANGGFSTVSTAPARRFDLMPDGERFALLRVREEDGADTAQGRQIVTVQNWLTELERLVPADR